MTTSTDRARLPLRNQHGFTLMEMMVALALAAIVMAALLTSYSMATRGFMSAGNYYDLEQDARVALEKLARDARQATGLTAYAASDISMAVATNFASDGSVSGAKVVRYY